jgi:hypothetical protein
MSVREQQIAQFSPISSDTVPHESGDFCLDPDVFLVDRKDLRSRPQQLAHGTLMPRQFRTNDGLTYVVHSGAPHGDARSDIGFTMTTPWLTTPDGYNQDVADQIMGAGFYVDLVSIEQNFNHKPKLERSAKAQLAIAESTARLYNRNPEKLNVYGDSRAAMIGLGVCACAQSYGTEINYAMLNAPCFARPLNIRRDLPGYSHMPLAEAVALLGLSSVPAQRLRRYHRTVSVHPRDSLYHRNVVSELVSGKAGQFARRVPTDTPMYVALYDNDIMGQADEWEALFDERGFENTYVDRQPGGHCSFLSEKFALRRRQILQALSEQALDSSDMRPYVPELAETAYDLAA